MLKFEIESLDGLDESTQGLYKEKKEGGFQLQVEGLADVDGLKDALSKERKTLKELREQFKPFKDIDLNDYADLQNRRAELEKHDPAAVEEMINGRVKQNNDSWQAKEQEWQERESGYQKRLNTLEVSNALHKIGEELSVNGPEAMRDFISRGEGVFRLVEGKVLPVDGNGDTIYGESGVEPLTMLEFGKKLQKTAPHLFKSSAGGGASNEGSGKGGTGSVKFKSDLVDNAAKAAFIRENGRNAYLDLPNAPPVQEAS